jgi:hypothetical protein
VSDLLLEKKTHTYSIGKNITVLIIDRIIPDNHPNVFQLSFSIHNLKNGSNMGAGITETKINHSQIETGYVMKSINISEFLLEHHNIKKKRNNLYQWEVSGPKEKRSRKIF